MKRLIVLVVVILSCTAIVAGKLHWDDKIEASVSSTIQPEEKVVKTETVVDENQKKLKMEELQELTKNLPADLQSKFGSAVENNEPIQLVIAGSNATPEEPAKWPRILKDELENTYGSNLLNVSIKEIPNKTSAEVVQEELYKEIIGLSPDVLLFEPFVLYDNGKIRFEDRLVNITTIIEEINREIPTVSILLQPAYPLYNAIYYPKEVEQFERFAIENNYTYLNHWDAWPNYQSDAIVEYLDDDIPNEKGHALWADYLKDYFIGRGN